MKKTVSVLMILCLVMIMSGCKKNIPVEDTTGDTQSVSEDSITGSASDSTATPSAAEMVPEEGAKLIFWTGDVEFGNEIAKNFEAEYGVPVTVEEVGLGALDKIALSGPAGTGADVFMCPNDDVQHGIASGLFLQLEDGIASELASRINEVGIKTVTLDGKLYGVPVSLETSCLFYNKDIVGEQPATTLEEIMDKAKDFNDPDNNTFYFLVKVGDGYKIYPMLSAYGFNLFGADGSDDNNPGFDTDEFEKGLELISDLKNIMPVNSIDLGNVSFLKSEFIDGKVAYEISGPWDVKEFKESGVNFGITVLPTYNGKALTPFAGIQSAHVSAFTQYPIAAQLFAKYLVSDESAGVMYEKAKKITTLKDISKVSGLADDEYMQAFVNQFNNSFPMPSASRTDYYWTISAQVCQAVFDGQLTPAQGRAKALEDWNTLLTTE